MTSRDRSRQALKTRCHRPDCPPDWDHRGSVVYVAAMHDGLPYRYVRCAVCGQQRLVREAGL